MTKITRKNMVQLSRFAALTVLFALLNYMGFVFYDRSGGLTTIKPFAGVALAIIMIGGPRLVWPVLLAGMLGGMIAKFVHSDTLLEMVFNPFLTCATLLTIHWACLRLFGWIKDFRAWRQLLGFIAVAAIASFASAFVYSIEKVLGHGTYLHIAWMAWFIPTFLSYVIFTPVPVILATAERNIFRHHWRLALSLAVLVAVVAVNLIPTAIPLLFTIPMALLLVTLICGMEGTALGLMLIQLIFTSTTVAGFPLAALAHLPLGYQLYFTQVFISLLIAVMLPVAAAIDERVKLRGGMELALERMGQSEQHAREMAARAEAASRAKSEFLASMSHELRTPLNAILGFSEILKAELYGPLGHAKYVEYAEDVFKSGAHLLDLINDVLDLSKIDAGKMELRESVFSISELINDAVLLIRERAKGHARLMVRLDGSVEILADKRLTKQIVLNLLSNALKFTPDGGTITIGAQEKPGQGLEIYVEDTGIGMTPAQIDKAFSPYGQIDSKIARSHQGTGLGLPISQSLARLHGGDLIAQSRPGGGTRMTFLLPESRMIRQEPLRSAG